MFRKKGFSRTTVEEIAELAVVSTVAVYNYYESEQLSPSRR